MTTSYQREADLAAEEFIDVGAQRSRRAVHVGQRNIARQDD